MLIKTASLNFSGINISPFEYHDGSQEKININSCFKRLLDNYLSENSKEYGNIAKIDLVFQKNRYTLLYKSNVGILRGKLISKQQFETIWDHVYQQNKDNTKLTSFNQFEVETLKCFDRMLYQAFLQSIYGKIDWEKIGYYDVQLYQQQLRNWHSKSYLKLNLKVQYINKYLTLKDLDILFLQQAQIEQISKSLSDSYIYTHCSKSMIIYKKDFFQNDENALIFSQKYQNFLNFNDDSAFIKLHDYLLISIHLSSKKIKVSQAQQVKETIQKIMKQYPHLKIIIGIDANQYIDEIKNFKIYPQNEKTFTTRKRRTNMQLQFDKAELIVEDVKDHIITNLEMSNMVIQTIQCQQINKELLPNQHHPFDHFAIFSNIIDPTFEPIKRNNLDVVIEQKRNDSKSVSTCNSTKKSNVQKNKKQIPIQQQTPQIIISPCDDYLLNTGKLSKNSNNIQSFNGRDLSRSSRNSNLSKSRNSNCSKNSKTGKTNSGRMNQILKFRKSSNGIQNLKNSKSKDKGLYLRPDVGGFKFRQTNQSKSVQKPNQKHITKISNPSPFLLALNTSKRTQMMKSQTFLSPKPNKNSRCKQNKY